MRRAWILPLGIAGAAVALAWAIRFGTDDAYISFHYARSLVSGHGLTWFGDHVEGYTNFGWVMWIAGGLELGADPLVWAWAGSLTALAGAVVLTWRLARVRAGEVAGACAAGIVATNFSFLAFGTSGLETMAQTALVAAAWWQVERLRRGELAPRTLAALSLTCALALLVRLDSAVPCAVLGAATAHRLARARASQRLWAAAIAPALLVVGTWLAWKLSYYGEILPNTAAAKLGGSATQGARYVASALHAYLLWPVLAAAAVIGWRASRLPLALAVAWLAYVALVGGDFMEFRFLVPALPAIAVAIAELVTRAAPARVPGPRLRAAGTVAVLASVSLHHAATDTGSGDDTRDSIQMLATFYGNVPDGDWGRIGRALRATLAGTGATLACNGAGAIPYFSELPTVDQLGLNDRWVAREGVPAPASYRRPGHLRFAPYDYLVGRRVTFVIGPPTLIRRGRLTAIPADMDMWLHTVLGLAPVPHDVAFDVVAAPIDREHALLLWYLTPTPDVTEHIRAAGWERANVHR